MKLEKARKKIYFFSFFNLSILSIQVTVVELSNLLMFTHIIQTKKNTKDIIVVENITEKMKCKKCSVELAEDEPQQNGMCIDCFAEDWAELVEKSPMVSPRILLDSLNTQ